MSHPLPNSLLHVFKEEFQLWAGFSNFEGSAKHVYSLDATSGEWLVRSKGCKQELEICSNHSRQICDECLKLVRGNSIVRACVRFGKKHFAAVLLSARLFQTDADVEKVIEDMKQGSLWARHESSMQELLDMNCGQLQQVVRTGFKCEGTPAPPLQQWIDVVVDPCLKVNVNSIPSEMQVLVARFTNAIASGLVDEADIPNLRIAAAAVSGQLSGHPLLMGLALQCRRQVMKREKGQETMRGRRCKETEREAALIADAGLGLAMACGNVTLAQQFGLPASSCRIDLKELELHGLPQPALALLFPKVLEDNWRLLDQKYVREHMAPKRALD